MKSAPAQPHRHSVTSKGQQNKCTGSHLGDHRSDCSTCHTHMKNKDKDGIQNNIKDSSQYHRCHAKTGESLSDQKAVEPSADQCEKGSGGVDGYICVCIRKGCITGTEPHEQLIFSKQKKPCQNCGQDKQHEESVI